MKYAYVKREVKVPSGVTLTLDGKKVDVKGPKGQLSRDFGHAKNVELSMQEDDTIVIEAKFPRKTELSIVGTLEGHIKNMILGVTQGFKYKMIIGYSHFPVTVKVNPDNVEIQNFQGERGPRRVETSTHVTITSTKENVIIEGIDKEEVSQVAARIQQGTKVHHKDHRIFQDGIFTYEKWAGENLIWHIKM